MTIQVTTATAPSYWASYLVNGDHSGLSHDEKMHADMWLYRNRPWYVVDVVRDDNGEAYEDRFTWSYDLYDLMATVRGGSVIDYVLHSTSERSEQR